ncbi:MAG: hypothetical protein KA526_09570 [Chitinophagales bacterium]|nr:hypothetical protein [Chitinophagales bacterium]
MGVDAIPQWIKAEEVLTGNELGKLASIAEIPNKDEINNDSELVELISAYKEQSIHEIKRLLEDNKIKEAWLVLLNVK